MKRLFFISVFFVSFSNGMDFIELGLELGLGCGEELNDAQVRTIYAWREFRESSNSSTDVDLIFYSIKQHTEASLIDAIKKGDEERVTALLKQVPANIRDEQDRTLLHIAIQAKQPFIAGKIFAASVKAKKQKSHSN